MANDSGLQVLTLRFASITGDHGKSTAPNLAQLLELDLLKTRRNYLPFTIDIDILP